jgi:hypothetical protein
MDPSSLIAGMNVEFCPVLWNGVLLSRVWYDRSSALTLVDKFKDRNSVSPVELGRKIYARESFCRERNTEDGL